jgi:hypothetical protein
MDQVHHRVYSDMKKSIACQRERPPSKLPARMPAQFPLPRHLRDQRGVLLLAHRLPKRASREPERNVRESVSGIWSPWRMSPTAPNLSGAIP